MSSLSLHRRPDWQEDGLCQQVDGDLFYPERGNDRSDQAKAICAACEVRTECLDWAISTAEPWGVWGGLTEKERRELRSSKPKQVAA